MWNELIKFLTGEKEIPQMSDPNLSYDLPKSLDNYNSAFGSLNNAIGQGAPNEFAPGGAATTWGKIYNEQLGASLRPDGLPLDAVELKGMGEEEEEKKKQAAPPELPPSPNYKPGVQGEAISQPQVKGLSWGPLTFHIDQPGVWDEIARRIMSFK